MSVQRVWRKFLNRLQPLLLDTRHRARTRHRFQLEVLEDRTVPTTLYVSGTTGSDQSGYGLNPNTPFQTIQFAINHTPDVTGDVIEVAAGTYTYNSAQDVTLSSFGTTGVIAVVGKQLTILGGFSTSNWVTANPTANQTIINGQGKVRGVYVVDNQIPTGTGLDIEGFTIENGLASSNTLANDVIGFGGGMFVDDSATISSDAAVVVKNDIFLDDVAQGAAGDTGGRGAGGGFAIKGGANTSLTNVTFENDTATGGSSTGASDSNLGGGALGGGFFAGPDSIVTGTNLTFTSDAATSNTSAGAGVDSQGLADALGGGIAVESGSNVSFTNVSVTDCTATAGNTSSANGAGAYGGGVYVENGSLSLINATITNNTATGGEGAIGGLAEGGGVFTTNANFTLNQGTVSENEAIGGNATSSSGTTGSAGGGGLQLTRNSSSTETNTLTVTNTLVTDNTVQLGSVGSTVGTGGGGAGVFLQGVPASITESTIANNHLGSGLFFGQSLLAISSNSAMALALNDSIVQNDSNSSTAAPINIDSSTTLTINRTLFVVPNSSTPLVNGTVSSPGTVNFVNNQSTDEIRATSAGFVSPGSPNFNYNLLPSSVAIGKGVNSGVSVDRAGNPRPANADLGAYQYVPPTVQFASVDNTGLKTASQIVVTVTLSKAALVSVSVNYTASGGTAVAGTDYRPVSGTLTFQVGQTAQTFVIPISNDGQQTGNLRINLTLSNPTGVGFGSLTQAVATIVDTYPNDNQQFVSGLYHTLLGRAADPGGLSYFLGPIQAAETPVLTTMLTDFVTSAAHYQDLIGDHTNGFYIKYLGRQATTSDAVYWGAQMAAGESDEQVIAQFVAGEEYFTKKANSSNLTWLQDVYQDILGRPLDIGGQAYFMAQLPSGDSVAARQNVATQILGSAEYRMNLISTDYKTLLHRPATASDEQYWLTQIQGGATDEQLLAEIGASPEGFLNNGNTNAKWIVAMYNATLGFTPDTSDLTFQEVALEDGLETLAGNAYSQALFNTAKSILNSPGYAANTNQPIDLNAPLSEVISQTFTNGLGRASATASDQAYWQAQFVGDPTQNLDVASAILSTTAFFNEAHPYP